MYSSNCFPVILKYSLNDFIKLDGVLINIDIGIFVFFKYFKNRLHPLFIHAVVISNVLATYLIVFIYPVFLHA